MNNICGRLPKDTNGLIAINRRKETGCTFSLETSNPYGLRGCKSLGCTKMAQFNKMCSTHSLLSSNQCKKYDCHTKAQRGSEYCYRHRYDDEDISPSAKIKMLKKEKAIAEKRKEKKQNGQSSSNTKAKMAGRKKYFCEEKKCTNGRLKGGYCATHGGGLLCKVEGCTSQARNVKDGVCYAHMRFIHTCSVDSCENKVFNASVCEQHQG